MTPRKQNSTSSSSEDDQAMILDEKKRKRMISNRESARRSRMKREQHVKDLNDQVTYFILKNSGMVQRIDEIGSRYVAVESENNMLRMHGAELKRKLELMEEILASCNNFSYFSGAVENNDDCYATDVLRDPLIKPWMQPPSFSASYY